MHHNQIGLSGQHKTHSKTR